MRAKKIINRAAVSLVALGVGSMSVLVSPENTFAQDRLIRDNGIYDYHRAPRYRESEAHPLRLVAYIGHPIGWLLREGVFRPISAFAASTEFTRSFFGFREPFDYREPECFTSSDEAPDCRQLPPLSTIGKYGEGADADADAGLDDIDSSQRQVFFPDVNFEFDKADLNDLGKGRVRQISQLLASVPNLNIVVEGHTDFIGTDEYNNDLGRRRAEAVIQELTELGIDPSRLSSISYGESKPIFTEEEDWARAVNRRAQFSVQGEAAAAAAAPAAE